MTPLAEVAYPEAYGEYKQTVVALAISEKEAGAHPAAKDLWSTHRRSETAAMLSRTARQAAGTAIYTIIHSSNRNKLHGAQHTAKVQLAAVWASIELLAC